MKSLPTSSGWMALAARTFLSQSSTKIYVSFHTHGACFWLNGAKSPVFDRVLAASLTLATTSWAVALSCPTATLDRATMRKATARTTRILLFFIHVSLDDWRVGALVLWPVPGWFVWAKDESLWSPATPGIHSSWGRWDQSQGNSIAEQQSLISRGQRHLDSHGVQAPAQSALGVLDHFIAQPLGGVTWPSNFQMLPTVVAHFSPWRCHGLLDQRKGFLNRRVDHGHKASRVLPDHVAQVSHGEQHMP